MKRALMLAAAVLVPFALLLAVGFFLLAQRPSTAPELNGPAASPQPPPQPSAQPSPQPPAAPRPVPPRVDEQPTPALASVGPLVKQCFEDTRAHLHQPQKLTVLYDTTAAGAFANVEIAQFTWSDPQLTACILDSFEDARFDGGLPPLARQSWTFTFSPVEPGH
jgi:hypothetical protein